MRLVVAALVAAVVGGCGGGQAPGTAHGTVRGRVLSSPTCPVEHLGSPCPPRPVVGASVVAIRDGHPAGSTTTRAGGVFTLSLPPGRYLVTATTIGGYPSTTASTVDVRPGVLTRLTLIVDSGIR